MKFNDNLLPLLFIFVRPAEFFSLFFFFFRGKDDKEGHFTILNRWMQIIEQY